MPANPRRTCLLRWLAAALCALVCHVVWANTELQRVGNAEALSSNRTDIPPDDAAWAAVRLPDRRPADGNQGVATWYRIGFDVNDDPPVEWAIHLRELMPSADIYVNGMHATYAYLEQDLEAVPRTFLFNLKAKWLHPGRNILHIRVGAPTISPSILSTVLTGPAPAVLDEHESWIFWQSSVRHVVLAGALLVGGMLVLFWTLRRQDVIYGLFGLVALGWATLTLGYFNSDAPLPQPWFGLVTAFTDYWTEIAMLMFVMRFIGIVNRRVDRVLLAYGGVSVLITIAGALSSDSWWWNWYSHPWEYTPFILTAISTALLIWHANRARSFENLILAAAVAFLGCANLADQIADEIGNREWLGITPIGYGVVLVVLGVILVRRFANALGTVEGLNASLERRVAAREAELAANFRALAEAQQRESVLQERNRIMRDMHDGIGAQLMISMQSLEHGRMDADQAAQVLRDCVEELRITIDSLDNNDNDLGALLGTVRYRLGRKLSIAGIEMDWEVGEIPPLAVLNDDGSLHAMRFVQEVLNNILKHSGATRIRVYAGWDPDHRRAVVEIGDNGRGFDIDAARNARGHRGLDNLRHRAEHLAARFAIESGAAGTRVRLEIPQT